MLFAVVVTCVLASTIAAHLDDKYCHNQETYYTIYQVPSHNCKCTAKQAGALRYHEGKLQVCNGKKYEDVCGCGRSEPLGSQDNPATSCRAILDANSEAKSGMYYVKADKIVMQTYCHMEEICGSRGWAMIMKIDGNKGTFKYDSELWTNKQTYNPAGAAGGLDKIETKLATYSHLPFSKLCLGMRTGNTMRWGRLDYTAASLYTLIADNRYRAVHMGRAFWKKFMPHPGLQRNCNREGFNVVVGAGSKARIGILSNQENDCNSPDSRIGFGTQGNRCGQNTQNSAGNEARCSPEGGDKSTPSFGYILSQERLPNAPFGSFDNPAPSCKAIYEAKKNARNGVYYLNLREKIRVYCYMDERCGSRGWTVIMKIDGGSNVFKYESNYWKSHNVYNVEGVFSDPFAGDMKLATYSRLPFNHLCLGMKTGATRWLKMDMKRRHDSLYSIISTDRYTASHLGKKEWRSLVPDSSMQRNCNREGFNVNPVPNKPTAKVRIGIVSNQENDCNSPDSRVGFGASGSYCGQSASNSAGNEGRCSADKGNKSIKGHGLILAQ